MQKVDEDSNKHDYVSDDVISPREEQELKEERNSTGTAEFIKHPPAVDPCQPLARHKAVGIAQSLVGSRDDTEVAKATNFIINDYANSLLLLIYLTDIHIDILC